VAEFIATQRAEFGVGHVVACRALGVSQAWFYKWCHGDGSPRRARRRVLAALIAALFTQHRGTLWRAEDHGGVDREGLAG
jgi:putative transposase